MFDFLYDTLQSLAGFISRNFMRVLAYPFNPGERLFVLYLTTSLVMAIVVWRYVAGGSRVGCHSRVAARVPVTEQHMAHGVGVVDVRYSFFTRYSESTYTSFTLMVSAGLSGQPEDSRYHGGFQSRGEQPFAWLGQLVRLRLGRIA